MSAILAAPFVSCAAVVLVLALGARGMILLVATALVSGLAWVLV